VIHTLPHRIKLACLPTPIHNLSRLSRYLGGPAIYIKRDDQTGLAFGGNKARKLEFLIADAEDRGADTIITGGAVQSNHCRQTAAAAASRGLHCIVVLGGSPPTDSTGNYFLDALLGAEIVWSSSGRKGESLDDIGRECVVEGKKPYIVPYGGSNAIGACGYVFAMKELGMQSRDLDLYFDYIVFASSSGGTQAGMTVGAHLFGVQCDIVGIDVDKRTGDILQYSARLAELSNSTAQLLKMDTTFEAKEFTVRSEYSGKGYAVLGEREKEAIHLLARSEGILLDPVYTGKAMGGLIDLIRNRSFGTNEKILFWHTGGAPALFAYSHDLS